MPSSSEVLVSSSLPQLAIWFFLVFPIVSTLLWTATKVAIGRSIWRLDFNLLALTLVLSLGQTIALSISISDGLGKYTQAAGSSYDSALKAQYASNILYVFALGSTKVTCIFITSTLIPWCRALYHNINIGLYVLTALSTIASLFAVAFQCDASHPWLYKDTLMDNNSNCFNRKQFWSAVEALNILTDVLLIILPICITSSLKTCLVRRTGLGMLYALRAAPAIAAIVKITYIAGDETPDDLCIALLTQIIQALSISITALSDPRIVIEIMHPSFLVDRSHTDRRNRRNHRHENLVIPRPTVTFRSRAQKAYWPFTHPPASNNSKADLNDVEKGSGGPSLRLEQLLHRNGPHVATDSRRSSDSQCSSLSEMEQKSRLANFANRLRQISRGGTVSEITSVSPESRAWPLGMIRHRQSCSVVAEGQRDHSPDRISHRPSRMEAAHCADGFARTCQCRSAESLSGVEDNVAALVLTNELGVTGDGIGVVRDVSVSCEVLEGASRQLPRQEENDGITVIKMTDAQRAVIAPWT